VAAQLAAAGVDFVLLDFEHATYSWREMLAFVQAARHVQLPVILKVAGLDRPSIQKALDLGIAGIQLARAESGANARQLVDFSRYPPAGTRAFCDFVGHTEFLPLDPAIAISRAEPLIIPMIETRPGLEQVDDIVRTPGIDAIYVGASDLSVQLGVPGRYDHPTQLAAIDRILAACRNVDVPVLLNSASPEGSARFIARGVRALIVCSDLGLIQVAAATAVRAHRQPADRRGATDAGD
jgi:2-keto-3-deoxy-L-rhamnonate aldolase RhmA